MTGPECKGVDGQGNKADGTPCRSPFVDPETGACPAHGPNGSARMSRQGAKGAEATRRVMKGRGTVNASKAPNPPETMEDAAAIASWATRAVITGDLDPRVAREVSSMLREFRSATKESDLAGRMKALEGKLGELEG